MCAKKQARLFNLSVLWFPHPWNDNNNTCHLDLFWRLNELMEENMLYKSVQHLLRAQQMSTTFIIVFVMIIVGRYQE